MNLAWTFGDLFSPKQHRSDVAGYPIHWAGEWLGDEALASMIRARDCFKFPKTRQLFTGAHDEALAVAAIRFCNPDRSPVGINR